MADKNRRHTGDKNKADDPAANHGNGADLSALTADRAALDAALELQRFSDPYYADELEDTGEFLPLQLAELDAVAEPAAEAAPDDVAAPPAEAVQASPAIPTALTERASHWLTHFEGEIQRLQGKWEVVAGELKLREARIEELSAEAIEREMAIATLQRDIEEHAATNESLQAELLRTTDRVAELIAGNAARALELSQTSSELAQANASLEALRDQVAVTEASIAQFTHTIDQSRAATLEAEQRLEVQILSGNELRATIQELEAYIDGRKQSWSTLNEKIEGYEDGLATLERSVAQKEAELAARSQELDPLKTKIADLERNAVELAERRKERDVAYEKLQAKLAEEAATMTHLRSELANAEKQAESERAALETNRNELSARILELTTSLRERDDQIASLHSKTGTAEQRAATYERELAERKAQVESLQRELAARADVVVRLEGALCERQQALDLLETNLQRLDQLGASLAGLDGEVSAVGAKIVSANLTTVNGSSHVNGAAGGQYGRKLIAIDGETRTSYALFDGETTIGRAAESDIRIVRPFISRLHARIRMRDSTTVIEDLGSKNGVLVNHIPVMRQTALHDGDVISLGGTLELTYVDPERPRTFADDSAP